MKYRCTDSFTVDKYDGNGFDTGDYIEVSRGSVWEFNNKTSIIGGEVHLDNIDTMEWLEIPRKTLNECFEKLN